MKEDDVNIQGISPIGEKKGPNWDWDKFNQIWQKPATIFPLGYQLKILGLFGDHVKKVVDRSLENIRRNIEEKRERSKIDQKLAEKIHAQNIFNQKSFLNIAKIHPV